MTGVQVLPPSEIESLHPGLDIFSAGAEPDPELLQLGLYPPLPICPGALIWGFELLRAARRQHLAALNCRPIPSRPAAEMLSLALKMESRAGRYSWPEKEKMLAYLEAPNGIVTLSPLIENHPDPQLAAKIASFAALPQELKSMVAAGQIDLKSAERVKSLPEDIFRRLQTGSLSFSQRRQFLNGLFEVSRKFGLPEQEISGIAGRALQDLQPLETIHRLRFPTLSDLEKRYAALEQELLGGSGLHLKPPPYYEGEAFTVEFTFHNAQTLARKIRALHTMEGRLDALFELLH